MASLLLSDVERTMGYLRSSPHFFSREFIDQVIFYSGIFVAAGVVLSSLITSDALSIYLCVAGFVLFVALGVVSVRGNILHPFIWFNGVFTIYSISAPLLYLAGSPILYLKGFASDYPIYREAMILQFVAIVIFSLAVQPKILTVGQLKEQVCNRMFLGGIFFAVISFVLSVVYLAAFRAVDIYSKYDKAFQQSAWFSMDFVYTLLVVGLSSIMLGVWSKSGKFPWAFVSIAIVYFLFSFLVSGERDLFFRLLTVSLFIYYGYYRKLNLGILVVFFLLMVVLAGVAENFKMFIVTGQLSAPIDFGSGYGGVVNAIFGDEFRTASGNLAYLLAYVPESVPFFKGETFLWELKRAFVPGFLVGAYSFLTTALWFTETFFPGVYRLGGGVGFTLVGLGYLNFGLAS